MHKTYILRISCPDRVGLVHEITSFFKQYGHNIIEIDQYVDLHQSRFFMRIAFTVESILQPAKTPPGSSMIGEGAPVLAGGGDPLASLRVFMNELNSGTEWDLHAADRPIRTAIFVTKESHCLLDILSRSIDGELPVEIPVIISNHEDLRYIADRFEIPFEYIPVHADTKSAAEIKQLEILKQHNIDLAVLAKYMQILSPSFIDAYRNRLINIHHSFLPAFPGSRPYHSAYYRGVKIIGATSHFVTEELDAGPIIEQDVIRIKHSDSIEDLKRKGKEVEKNVLSRALWYYANRRVMTYGNKTIIF
ncbi:MAG: formyltetrahydrofolate deformylase [Bacteroidetes bacterium]|nr:formyltetrahydrofolate deformylase [Bacteroidota bacterium]MCH8524383.1 formyltetrahydrofolate deformylase [Balneolales bacterium]